MTIHRSEISTVTISAGRRNRAANVGELWRYRELLYFLLWRDVKVRYKQTVFGALWAVLQPLLLAVVFTLFLGRIADIETEGVPYALFAFAALVPWSLFSQSMGAASASLVDNSNLVAKIYFPRLVLPLAAAGAHLLDFVFALFVLLALFPFYDLPLEPTILVLPLFLLVAFGTAVALGIWFAGINVRYRDVRYAVPFVIQVWLFASPIIYPLDLIPDRWRDIYSINPMVGAIEGFRWALFPSHSFPGTSLAIGIAVMVAVLVSGIWYFRRVERTFADVI